MRKTSRELLRLCSAGALLLLLAGCATGGRAPVIDLSAPGWEVRQGQAIWKPNREKPEIAGDLVVSLHPSGNAFVQFSKTLPIASAQSGPGGWEIDFPPQQRHYAGRGEGPRQVVWLQLLRALQDRAVAKGWVVTRGADGNLTLTNPRSGEMLEAHFL